MSRGIPEETKRYLRRCFEDGKVACLTGAGISAESGIPTFRGKGGLWEKYDPELYGNASGLLHLLASSPQRLVDFIADFYSILLKAHPNPGHFALALLEKEGLLGSIITQNIDNLHQGSGSRSVIELHGNAYRIRCGACGNRLVFEKERIKEMVELLRKKRNSRFALLKVLSRYFPRCSCRARFRIDIVLFGEMLPEEELQRAYETIETCKTLLLVGTSLVVYPAANLPAIAKERGARIIEINNAPSAFSHLCDVRLNGPASKILPEVAQIAGLA